jgi:hypothetical protein
MSRMMMLMITTSAQTLTSMLCSEYAPQVQAALGKHSVARTALETLQGCLALILAGGTPDEPKR